MTHVQLRHCQSVQQPFTAQRSGGVRGAINVSAGPTRPATFRSSKCPSSHVSRPCFAYKSWQCSTRGRSLQRTQAAEVLYELADIDAKTAGTIASLLGPVLNLGQLLMIVRIVLSWYPNINYGKLPWVLAVRPTEPILRPTRKVIPIVGGLDVTPVVWVALLSFINEILLGPQGILNLLQRKADL